MTRGGVESDEEHLPSGSSNGSVPLVRGSIRGPNSTASSQWSDPKSVYISVCLSLTVYTHTHIYITARLRANVE